MGVKVGNDGIGYFRPMNASSLRPLLLLLIILSAGMVLVGALAKMQHWGFNGDTLIATGMLTEVLWAALLVVSFWKGRKSGE